MSSSPPAAATSFTVPSGAAASPPPPNSAAAPGSPPPAMTSGFGSTSPTTAVHAPPTGPPPTAAAPAHRNPKVAELQVMFPTVDVGVIEIVLESVDGSQDRAIEQLLSITDENFKPEETVGARREAEQQLDLDAEFARSLQLEDEHNARQQSRFDAQNQSQTGNTNPGAGGLLYQPRVRRNQQQPQSQQDPYAFDHDRYNSHPDGPPQGAGPGMLQVEEKLQRAAEVGKQTFNNLFSLAKNKYAEFQQNQQASQTQGSSGGLWGGENQHNQHQNQGQQQYQSSAAGWGRGGAAGIGGGRGGVQNYGYGQQQGQVQGQYGPRGVQDDDRSFSTRSESFSSESTNDRDAPSEPRPVIRQSSNRWNPSDIFEDPLPAGRSTPTGNRVEMGGPNGRRSPGVGSPENRGMTRIDASKLGILPKKKVDLLSTSPQSQPPSTGIANQPKPTGDLIDTSSDPNPSIPGASQSIISKIPPTPPGRGRGTYALEDSDDELEYTKSPFDEK